MFKFHENVYRCQACGDINKAKRRISPKSYIIGIPYIIFGILLIVFPALLLPWIALGYFIFFRRECERCHSRDVKIVSTQEQKKENCNNQFNNEIRPISKKESDPLCIDPKMGQAKENSSAKYERNTEFEVTGERASKTISMVEEKVFDFKPFSNYLVIFGVLIFILFAWVESFDDSATAYLNESLNGALGKVCTTPAETAVAG